METAEQQVAQAVADVEVMSTVTALRVDVVRALAAGAAVGAEAGMGRHLMLSPHAAAAGGGHASAGGGGGSGGRGRAGVGTKLMGALLEAVQFSGEASGGGATCAGGG
jgi:hypothetical protein